jgi:alpha-galactosidase
MCYTFVMLRVRLFALVCVVVLAANAAPQSVAPTPPMGWNSWDAYGLTIDEAQYRDNVKVLAGMKQYGWQYAVIDEGWYMLDPLAGTVATRQYVWDANGNLIPAVDRFPSSAKGAGFKPLADWVHAQGLKFGIHIVRGIPRQVVKDNLPIAGTSFHAQDAADIQDKCPWDEGNFGVSDTPAGQAYYDGMMKLYAGWGLDFIKVDCISDHPYRPTEIRQVAEAIRKTGRPMVLSLSPGPTSLKHAAEVAKYSEMWRITDDHWDVWASKRQKNGSEFPFGLSQEFDRIAEWQPYVKPGNWPDPDMLPEGSLTPRPGWGDARQSRYTQDEQRTEFTLWAISRSPLVFGGNLTKLDEFTRSLMTNKEVLDLNQNAVESGAVRPSNNKYSGAWRAWSARTKGPDAKTYIAVFNTSDKAGEREISWTDFHLTDKPQAFYDVYNRKHIPAMGPLRVEVPPHGCALFRVE